MVYHVQKKNSALKNYLNSITILFFCLADISNMLTDVIKNKPLAIDYTQDLKDFRFKN